MKLSRQRLLAAGIAAGAGWAASLRFPGEAAEFSYKLGNDQPLTNPMTAASLRAARRILSATSGRFEVKVFPNSALGDDPSMATQLRAGALELLQTGPNILVSFLPAASLEALPFTFSSREQLMKAANGPLGDYIGAAAAKIGLYKFGVTWYGGGYQTQSALRPIATPADFKGLKIRVPPGAVDVATFKAFGAIATPLSAGEVYVALQTHLVDAIEVPQPSIQNFKWYEVLKYVSITNHKFSTYLMLANGAAWQRLPKGLQETVEREFNRALDEASAQQIEDEKTIEATLKSEGLVFNRPNIEPFRQVIRSSGLFAQWRDEYDPQGWVILEKAAGKLT